MNRNAQLIAFVVIYCTYLRLHTGFTRGLTVRLSRHNGHHVASTTLNLKTHSDMDMLLPGRIS